MGEYIYAFFPFMPFAVEYYCYYLKITNKGNNLEYNLWMPVEFIYYSTLVTSSLKKGKSKTILSMLIIFFFFIYFLILFFFFKKKKKFKNKLKKKEKIICCSFIYKKEGISKQPTNN